MRLGLIVAPLFLLACTPAEEVDVMSEGCDARAVSEWAAEGASYSIEATSVGPDCERAVATLIIRDSSGRPLFANAHLSAQVMTLAAARAPAAMQGALAEWIDPAANSTMAGSGALPDWPANADAPANGEFPFYPALGYDRAGYEDLRAANAPLFCYVQGMESLACVALRDGRIEEIGVQTFPG